MSPLLLLIVVAAIGVTAIIGTAREVRRDGYRAVPTDPARQR